MKLEDFKKEIGKEILRFYDQKHSALAIDENKDLIPIFNHLRKLLQDGKRIRAYVAFLSYKANGGKENNKAIKLLSFIEIFHAFCLVHDDIMDKADERHGIETIHKFVSNSIKTDSNVDPDHFGNSQAILIGDFLFSWSWEIILTNKDFDAKVIANIQKIFQKMIDEVFFGQMLDLNVTNKNTVSDEEIIKKMLLKTAGYSFIKPMITGATLADNKSNTKLIEKLGSHLGLAFQIQDDLLDVVFDTKLTKKSSFNDISQHQHTLLSNYILRKGNALQKKSLKDLFGKKLSGENKKRLRKIFHESGAIKYAEKEIYNNLTQASEILKKMKIDKEYKVLFNKLISNLISRSN